MRRLNRDAGRACPDEPVSGAEPVIAALRGPASDEELRGFPAALTTYRGALAPRRGRWLLTRTFGTGAAGVAVGALLTGGVAAAYSAHLPDPVQRVAHRLLGPLGVPEPARPASQRRPTRLTSAPGPTAARAMSTPQAAHHVSAPGQRLTLTATVPVVPLDGSATVRGVLHAAGHREAHELAVLVGRPATDAAWRRVSAARTDAAGSVVLRVTGLRVNTQLRLRIGAVASAIVTIRVRPDIGTAVSCTATRDRCTVTVTVLGGHTGDRVLLRRRSGSAAVTEAVRRLDSRGRASFVVATDPANPQTVWVWLPASRLHAEASTRGLVLPPRPTASSGRSGAGAPA